MTHKVGVEMQPEICRNHEQWEKKSKDFDRDCASRFEGSCIIATIVSLLVHAATKRLISAGVYVLKYTLFALILVCNNDDKLRHVQCMVIYPSSPSFIFRVTRNIKVPFREADLLDRAMKAFR